MPLSAFAVKTSVLCSILFRDSVLTPHTRLHVQIDPRGSATIFCMLRVGRLGVASKSFAAILHVVMLVFEISLEVHLPRCKIK